MNPRNNRLCFALGAVTALVICALAPDAVASSRLSIDTNPNEWCAAAALGLTLLAAGRDRH
jgi:hypothetical protein